jgi:DHA1 family bicyclomycin/chloramphenicol resistance-like MFS transporter
MKPRTLIGVLAVLSMMGSVSFDAYLPALPAIEGRFGISAGVGQQSMTIYLTAFAAMTLFYGTLSDSFGRRPVILGALMLYLGGAIGSGLSMSFSWLMFFRFLQGLSAGAGSVVSRAIIADRFAGAEAERMMSYVSMVFGIAPALAPILGGWVQAAFGWRWIFFFIAIFAAGLLTVCAGFLGESLPPVQRHAFHFKVIVRNYWRVAVHGKFWLQSVATALMYSTLMIYIGAAPAVIFNILHLRETDFAWLFIPLVAGLTLGSLLSARLSHRPSGGAASIRIGFIIVLVSAVAHVVISWKIPSRLPWAVLPIGTGVFGAALGNPAMALRAMSYFPDVRGLVASLQTCVFLIFLSLSSGVIAPLLFDSGLKLALAAAVGVFASLPLWYLSVRGERAEPALAPVPAGIP